jgi:hypothetical protein
MNWSTHNSQTLHRQGHNPISPTEGQKFQQHIEGRLEFLAVFQNVHLFIPQYFAKALTMFCGTLNDKHQWSMKPRRHVSGRKLDGTFKARVSRNKEFPTFMYTQPHQTKRQQGMHILALLDFRKSFLWVVQPITLFSVSWFFTFQYYLVYFILFCWRARINVHFSHDQ